MLSSTYTFADVAKQNKDKYVKACVKNNMSKQSCECQYNVMNPILSKKLGKNWMLKPMYEKDMDLFSYAISVAVNKCAR